MSDPNDGRRSRDPAHGTIEIETGEDGEVEQVPAEFERTIYQIRFEPADETDDGGRAKTKKVEKIAVGHDYDERINTQISDNVEWETAHPTWDDDYVFRSGRQGARLFDADETTRRHLKEAAGINVPEIDDIPYNPSPIRYDPDADDHSDQRPPAARPELDDDATDSGSNATMDGFSTADEPSTAGRSERNTPASRYSDSEHVASAGMTRPQSGSYPDNHDRVDSGPINYRVHRLPRTGRRSPSTCPRCDKKYALVSKRELERGTYPNLSFIMEMVLADAADICCVKCNTLFDLEERYDDTEDGPPEQP